MSIKTAVVATIMAAQTFVAYRAYKKLTKNIANSIFVLEDKIMDLSDSLSMIAQDLEYNDIRSSIGEDNIRDIFNESDDDGPEERMQKIKNKIKEYHRRKNQ